MKLLIVAATLPETAHLRALWGGFACEIGQAAEIRVGNVSVSILHTGIGMVNTAYHLGRYLLANRPDFALQIGIAGSFTGGPEIGSVVEVIADCYADLVAEDQNGLRDLKEMGFENFRVQNELYYNEIANPAGKQSGHRTCKGITVNRVHGRATSIAEAVAKWQPAVESMEGAAFFQACLMDGVPFMELRGISNRVEPRNRAAWQIGKAVMAVQTACLEWIDKLNARNENN